MRNGRPRTCLPQVRTVSTLLILAVFAAALVVPGCSDDATIPGPSPTGLPQANFSGQLDPGTAAFVLTRVDVTQPGQLPVAVICDLDIVDRIRGHIARTGAADLFEHQPSRAPPAP
jgi:hypothetical protein